MGVRHGHKLAEPTLQRRDVSVRAVGQRPYGKTGRFVKAFPGLRPIGHDRTDGRRVEKSLSLLLVLEAGRDLLDDLNGLSV